DPERVVERGGETADGADKMHSIGAALRLDGRAVRDHEKARHERGGGLDLSATRASMPGVEDRALTAEDVARERRAEVPSGGPVDGAEKARRRHRATLAGELADDIVERALSGGRGPDPAVEPGHHEGGAVVERGGHAGA